MWILALLAIIIGVFIAAFDVKLWFDPLTWFVLSIALSLVFGGFSWPPAILTRRESS